MGGGKYYQLIKVTLVKNVDLYLSIINVKCNIIVEKLYCRF